jgi:hypothetical protein
MKRTREGCTIWESSSPRSRCRALRQRLSYWEQTPRLRTRFAEDVCAAHHFLESDCVSSALGLLDQMDSTLERIERDWERRKQADEQVFQESSEQTAYFRLVEECMAADPLSEHEHAWLNGRVNLQNHTGAAISRKQRLNEIVFSINEEQRSLRSGADPLDYRQHAIQPTAKRRLHNAVEKLGDKFFRNLPKVPSAGTLLSKQAFLNCRYQQREKRLAKSEKRKAPTFAKARKNSQDHPYTLTRYFRTLLQHVTVSSPLKPAMFHWMHLRHVGVTQTVTSCENGRLRKFQNDPALPFLDGGVAAYRAAGIETKTSIEWENALLLNK